MKEKLIIMDKINAIQAEQEPDHVCALDSVIWKHIHHEKLNVLKEVLKDSENSKNSKNIKRDENAAEMILGNYIKRADLKTMIDEIPVEKLEETARNIERILQYIQKRIGEFTPPQ
jgi:hypothetical protein